MNHLKTHLKLYIIGFMAVAMFAITSCNSAKNDSKQSPQSPDQQQTMEQNNLVNPEPETNLSEIAAGTEEIETQEISAPVAETEQAAPVQNNAEVMLNPRHGEPFHRCDIPVGAPLNSPPANTTRQTANNPVQATTPQTSGSAPSVANNPLAPTIQNAMRMNSAQSQSTTAPANSGPKPSLNPAHGQPWHRCDIAVGSPLP